MSNPSLEEMMAVLAQRIGKTLNLDDYFEILLWANVSVLAAEGGEPWKADVGFEIDGVGYALLFMSTASAEGVASRCGKSVSRTVNARDFLSRLRDGWGLIVDYGTPSEVRISPAILSQLDEEFHVKRLNQEADHGWLARTNDELARRGVPWAERPAMAMKLWSSQNGLQLPPGSRRARRIARFFVAGGSPNPADASTELEAWWRAEYASDPYLAHLDDDALRERLSGIADNLAFADRAPLPHELDQVEWLELHAHVSFEFERRGLGISGSTKNDEQTARWPRLAAAEEAHNRYSARPRGQLFRFSDAKYLEPLLQRGQLTLFPAARYADPSLWPAQYDDELRRAILVDPAAVRVDHIAKDGTHHEIPLLGSLKYTMKSPANYYVLCATTAFDLRYFDDFRCDACLVIHDADGFSKRLYEAMEKACPGWVGAEKLVNYFDPVRSWGRVFATFHKDFRYSYQREYRFAWDPPAPQRANELPPIELSLGSLEDVAALIKL